MLAEAIIKNGIEIVVVTDHNTTKGIKKVAKGSLNHNANLSEL